MINNTKNNLFKVQKNKQNNKSFNSNRLITKHYFQILNLLNLNLTQMPIKKSEIVRTPNDLNYIDNDSH